MNQKTTGTRMVEGLIGGFLQSALASATENAPLPPLSEDGQPITADSIVEQLTKHLHTEPKTAFRICMVLGAFLARREGIKEKEALTVVAAAWAQTANLTGG